MFIKGYITSAVESIIKEPMAMNGKIEIDWRLESSLEELPALPTDEKMEMIDELEHCVVLLNNATHSNRKILINLRFLNDSLKNISPSSSTISDKTITEKERDVIEDITFSSPKQSRTLQFSSSPPEEQIIRSTDRTRSITRTVKQTNKKPKQ